MDRLHFEGNIRPWAFIFSKNHRFTRELLDGLQPITGANSGSYFDQSWVPYPDMKRVRAGEEGKGRVCG